MQQRFQSGCNLQFLLIQGPRSTQLTRRASLPAFRTPTRRAHIQISALRIRPATRASIYIGVLALKRTKRESIIIYVSGAHSLRETALVPMIELVPPVRIFPQKWMNFPMRRRRTFCCWAAFVASCMRKMETQSMDRWRAIVRGLCVVKIPEQRFWKGPKTRRALFRCVYPQLEPLCASPTEYLEYFTCCAGVKDAADHARQHDAPLSYILPLPPPENLLLCCEEWER